VVELEVLGPLVVWAGGRQLRLGPALRVLLLCLLCADGELVLAGRLAGLLSETGSPGGSPATLRSHVSHLRRAISDAAGQGRDDRDSVIVTDRVGGATAYALRLDADKVDASRFVREVDRGIRELQAGDAEQAAETLRAATRLWRGQPLADVAGRSFSQAEIRRLRGTYRAALVARVDADAQCGRHRSIIGELEALADQWPDDEAVRVLLVTCLYRSGRTAEAARACRAAIEFTLEHGLESRRLAALQVEVLTGSLQVTGPAGAPPSAVRLLAADLPG
jgi:DNA-binding SARP family transcriptional activator